MKWSMISTGDIALRKGGSVDPKKHQDEVFELYSIPAFDAGAPEVIAGSAIGSSKKAVQPNDVMISRIVPHIRRACVVGPANGHRQIASGEWIIFRDERIWPQYLRWLLVGDVFHSAFMRTVSGVGGSLLRARPVEVFKIQIPLPPLDEQKRIAGILDAADALRAKRREAFGQLDTLLQSTFLDMFGDPVTNPKGWEVVRVGDEIGFLTSGSRGWAKYYAKDGETFIRIQNLKNGQLELDDIAFVNAPESAEAKRTMVEPGDVLLSITADLGRTAVVPGGIAKAHINQHLAILRFTSLNPVFVSYQLASKGGQAQFNRLNREGVKAGLNFNDVKSIRLTNPPLNLQHRFAAIVESIEQQKASQRAYMAELDTLFASLQSRAFRGDL